MSESSEIDWGLYIADMLIAARKVVTFTKDFQIDAFVSNLLVYDATLRNLALIGEAATHVPLEVREQNSDIPWRMIIAARNQLIHGYLGLDDEIIWSMIQDDVPALIKSLEELSSPD